MMKTAILKTKTQKT